MNKTAAKFIYDVPERNADLYYATRFDAPDACIYFEFRGKKHLVLSDLEIDRGKKEAQVDRVLRLRSYGERARAVRKNATFADILDALFNDQGIRQLIVPPSTSCVLVDQLRRKRYKVEIGEHPFYPERVVKSREEFREMEKAQRTVFGAMRMVEETLHKSRIKAGKIFSRGKLLTSELLRYHIQVFLLERGYLAKSPPIISCGLQSCDPHCDGSGPLKPHTSIIVDIFPQSLKTKYHGDATRTFCKGRASDALKKLYATVLEGQQLGLNRVRAGMNGRAIHAAIQELFETRGYKTGEYRGRMQGFFHGTGHSIGLEVHEEPARINASNYILKAGNIMSVEPGLYYPDIGGVRIEDLVFVTSKGCDVLGGYPKRLVIA